jgi:Icc protein
MPPQLQTVLQFTDLHLFTDPTTRLKEVCTWESFARVLAAARQRFPTPDLIVITGDIAHDEATSTYRALRGLLGDWLPRCRVLPGNHDYREGLRAAFPELLPAAHRATDEPVDAPLRFAATIGEWRLLGLDTHQPGQLSGRLEAGQLAWLDGQTRAFPRTPTLLFAHHPPRPIATPWLDRIRLENAEPLAEIVDRSPQVAAFFTGHVHQELALDWRGRPLFTTPSTGVQFQPGTETLVVDGRWPGFRVIQLRGREFTTAVMRVEPHE